MWGAENWTLQKVDQIYGKFLNVVREKDVESQLDRSLKRRRVTKSQGGEEYPP